MMRKILITILMLVVGFSLVACNDDPVNPNNNDNNNTENSDGVGTNEEVFP